MKKSDFCCCWAGSPASESHLLTTACCFPVGTGWWGEATLVPGVPVWCSGGEGLSKPLSGYCKAAPKGLGDRQREEQEPTRGSGEPPPKYQNTGGWTWGHAERLKQHTRYLVSMHPVSAGLWAQQAASAEPAYLYIVISMERQFKAAQTELNLMLFNHLWSLALVGMIYECFSEIHFDTNTARDI